MSVQPRTRIQKIEFAEAHLEPWNRQRRGHRNVNQRNRIAEHRRRGGKVGVRGASRGAECGQGGDQ
jgi:hypothetical protein